MHAENSPINENTMTKTPIMMKRIFKSAGQW